MLICSCAPALETSPLLLWGMIFDNSEVGCCLAENVTKSIWGSEINCYADQSGQILLQQPASQRSSSAPHKVRHRRERLCPWLGTEDFPSPAALSVEETWPSSGRMVRQQGSIFQTAGVKQSDQFPWTNWACNLPACKACIWPGRFITFSNDECPRAVRADLSCSSLTLSGMMLKNHFYFWLLSSELTENLDLLL